MRGTFLVVSLFAAGLSFAQQPLGGYNYQQIQIQVEFTWENTTFQYDPEAVPAQDPEDFTTWTPVVEQNDTHYSSPVTLEQWSGCMFDPEEYPEACLDQEMTFLSEQLNFPNVINPPFSGGHCTNWSCAENLMAQCRAANTAAGVWSGNQVGPSTATCSPNGYTVSGIPIYAMECSCTCQGNHLTNNNQQVVVQHGCGLGGIIDYEW